MEEREFAVYSKTGNPATYDLHNKLKYIFPWKEIPGEVGDIKIVYDVNGEVVDLNYNSLETIAQFYMFNGDIENIEKFKKDIENITKFFEEKADVELKNLEDIK